MSDKAPQALGHKPVWSTAQKDCVGTALGQARLWFTIGQGIVTEVFYPRIDIPQIRDLGFIVADDQGFWQELKALPEYAVDLVDPGVPFPTIRHRHERFTFTLQVCADPSRDVLLLDFVLEGDAALRPYLLCATRLGADATQNRAWVDEWAGRTVLWAEQGPFGLALACRDASGRPALGPCSVGEVGVSDLWQDFHRHGRMRWRYGSAGPGEVALGGRLPRSGTLALAMGTSREASGTLAWSSLAEGFTAVRDAYCRGWRDWRPDDAMSASWSARLPPAVQTLYRRSTNVLHVHEDRTFPGALVASLSIPWGESSDSQGGYHLVWARDLVESAGALLATGAHHEARRILSYLISTQQADGHWLQNQWLGGKPFWQGIQLDEAAFPVLLAAALRSRNALGDIAVEDMITRALQFIIRHGPCTAQDRWEEDSGINTFTLAVAIAALVEGAEFLSGRARDAALMVADDWNARLEDWTFVTDTDLARRFDVPGYYLRIAPDDILHHDGAQHAWLRIKNRADDPHLAASAQVSTDFLQLVRYGLRAADDTHVVASVRVVDGLLKTDTPSGPVWHRYNGDGYGEHPDGQPFDGTGQGRGWPLLVGERGHYAISAGADALPYLEAMTRMTGRGGLLPEQIWDSDPVPGKGLFPGKPTGSAMPLVWAHAEFIKLCHSQMLGYPVDRPAATWRRYRGRVPQPDFRVWRFRQQVSALRAGQTLRVLLASPFVLHWGVNGWRSVQDTPSEDWGFGHVAILPCQSLQPGERIQFTVRWLAEDRWQGEDFEVVIVAAP